MDDYFEPTEEPCPKCNNYEVVAKICGSCGGDGFYDCYDEDPLWYDPGGVRDCDACSGWGHHEWCRHCGWDLLEKLYLNGMGRIYFPASWTDEQVKHWLLLRDEWRTYQIHPREYCFQGPLQLSVPSVTSCSK